MFGNELVVHLGGFGHDSATSPVLGLAGAVLQLLSGELVRAAAAAAAATAAEEEEEGSRSGADAATAAVLQAVADAIPAARHLDGWLRAAFMLLLSVAEGGDDGNENEGQVACASLVLSCATFARALGGAASSACGDENAYAARAAAEALKLTLRGAMPRVMRPSALFRLPHAARALLLEAWEEFVGGSAPDQVRDR